jgi:hypothetical protein
MENNRGIFRQIQVWQHQEQERFLTYLREIGLLNGDELVNATYEQKCMHNNAVHCMHKHQKYLNDNKALIQKNYEEHFWKTWDGSQQQLWHWEDKYLGEHAVEEKRLELLRFLREEDEFSRKRHEIQRNSGNHDKEWKKNEKIYIREDAKAAAEGLLKLGGSSC